jgi:hypothetical protein
LQNKQFNQWTNLNQNASLDKNLPYEVIGINKVWNEDVDKYVKNIIDKENGIFTGKLYLNASDQSSYKLLKLAVKVYDVTEDFKFYSECEEAKKHQPKMSKDKGKNNVWSEDDKKDLIITTCYETNKIDLKKDWIYSSANSKPLRPWVEVFSYDEKIFLDHMKNSTEQVELISIFDKNYKLEKIENASALIRIDYIIEDATFNSENTQLNDFQWPSTTQKGKTNNSLAEAIRNTLQEPSVSPKDKILYSYYIKLGNNSKSE